MEIPLTVDLDIHAFSGSGISDYESGLTNCILHEKNGKLEVTQRSSIDVSEDAAGIGGIIARARGIYYWETESNIFIVNDDTVYEATQDGGEVNGGGEISSGTERVTMLETIGVVKLVILDAENNEGWIVNTPASSVTAIASNFPSSLCHGGTILDGYLFVMDEDGIIYNSAVDDPATFPALGFLEAERENDKGVYLGKHHSHAAAFGTRTLEFFYDAKNTTGSPLNRREDIMYNIGCPDGLGVWENGDITYFLGSNPSGQIAIYKLENFQPIIISPDTLNSYLTQGLTQEGLRVVFSGWSAMGHDTLIMTVYTLTGASPGLISPKICFSYDSVEKRWGFINTTVNSHTLFPLMAFTKRTGGQNATAAARTGEGIMYNGDIININDKLIPVDTLLGADGVYADDVYEDDVYVSAASDEGINIDIKIRTGLVDGKIRGYKFQNSEYLLMEKTKTAQTLTIKHSDESSVDFDSGNAIDVSQDRKEVYQGGRFMKRNFQLEYSGNEQIFIEVFGADIEAGE